MKRIVWAITIVAALNYAALMWVMVFDLSPATGGLKPLDLRVFGYGFDDVMTYLGALSFDTARLLTGPVRLLDTSFPILFGAAGFGWIWLLSKGRSRFLRIIGLAIPIGYTVFDLIENVLIGRILTGAIPSLDLIWWACAMTQVKFAFVVLMFGALYVVAGDGKE